MMANEKLRNACFTAFETLKKIGDEKYADLQSGLEFVVGSFDYDQNPVGLYEFGKKALPVLKKIKEKSPRAVTKKLLEDLEKALKA
jgi:hypothetical protein